MDSDSLPAAPTEVNEMLGDALRGPDGEYLTDLGNARRLVRRYGADIKFCHPWVKWLAWDGKRWALDETGAVMRLAKETARGLWGLVARGRSLEERASLASWAARSESDHAIRAMVKLGASELGIPVLPTQLDASPWLLNVANGVLDLRTGELLPQRRELLITKLVPWDYDPQAACPLWDSFLNRIMGADAGLRRYLQKAVGYSLTGVTKEQCMFLLYGTGSNGKSTFLNSVLSLMGEYGKSAAPDLLLTKQGERHPTEVADLHGARFISAIETEEGRKMAEVLVKQLTGQDRLKARRMREDFWEFEMTGKIWLASNHKPQVRGTDWAIWRRIRLIPFAVTIPDDASKDKDLPEKLRAEMSGILRWAVDGCLAWQREGLEPPEAVKSATRAYREEMDVVGRFINECCVAAPGLRAATSQLYAAYLSWCAGNRATPLSQKALAKLLEERGFEPGRTGADRFWKGLRVIEGSFPFARA